VSSLFRTEIKAVKLNCLQLPCATAHGTAATCAPNGSPHGCTSSLRFTDMGVTLAEVCDPGACRKGVPKKRKKPKKVISTDDGISGDVAVVAGPVASSPANSPAPCQEVTETTQPAPVAGRQRGSDDPAGSPAVGSREADTADQPGRSDHISHAATLHDPVPNGRGAAACAARDGDGDNGAAAEPTASLRSRAATSGDCDAPCSSADGVSTTSAAAAVATEKNRPPGARARSQDGNVSGASEPTGSTPPACEVSTAASGSQPPAALPAARTALESSGYGGAAEREEDDGSGAVPQREANARLPTTSAVTLGTGESSVAGLRPALSENSEPQADHEPRRAAAAGPRGHHHVRSLSRVSVGSTVSSGVSEHPSHGATALDPDPSQEAVDAARTCLAAVAAEASLAVGSMHLFAETLGA